MAQTGYKGFSNLELFIKGTNSSLGIKKANSPTDPDYIAAAYEPGTCLPDARFFNDELPYPVKRNNCQFYESGSSVNFTVPANLFVSSVSRQEANQMAAGYAARVAQQYANQVGTCTVVSYTNMVRYSFLNDACHVYNRIAMPTLIGSFTAGGNLYYSSDDHNRVPTGYYYMNNDTGEIRFYANGYNPPVRDGGTDSSSVGYPPMLGDVQACPIMTNLSYYSELDNFQYRIFTNFSIGEALANDLYINYDLSYRVDGYMTQGQGGSVYIPAGQYFVRGEVPYFAAYGSSLQQIVTSIYSVSPNPNSNIQIVYDSPVTDYNGGYYGGGSPGGFTLGIGDIQS